MDDVTKAALEIAVEQLEEAERIIEALTEENVRLKQEAAGTWATIGNPSQITWTSPSNTTVTHVALMNASTASTNASASAAVMNLTAQTKQFKESMEKLRKSYKELL